MGVGGTMSDRLVIPPSASHGLDANDAVLGRCIQQEDCPELGNAWNAGLRWEPLCLPIWTGPKSELDLTIIRIRRYNDPGWPTPISSYFTDSQPGM
jgi:hypothetical protein